MFFFTCFTGGKARATGKHQATRTGKSPAPQLPTEREKRMGETSEFVAEGRKNDQLLQVVESTIAPASRAPSREKSPGSSSNPSLSRSSSSESLALEIERAGELLADAMTKRKMCYSQTCKRVANFAEICSAEDKVLVARKRLIHVLQRALEK